MALFALPRSSGRMFPREIRHFYKTNEGYRRRNNGGSAESERRLGRTDVPYLSPSTQTTMGNKYVTCHFLSLPLLARGATSPIGLLTAYIRAARSNVFCIWLWSALRGILCNAFQISLWERRNVLSCAKFDFTWAWSVRATESSRTNFEFGPSWLKHASNSRRVKFAVFFSFFFFLYVKRGFAGDTFILTVPFINLSSVIPGVTLVYEFCTKRVRFDQTGHTESNAYNLQKISGHIILSHADISVYRRLFMGKNVSTFLFRFFIQQKLCFLLRKKKKKNEV